MRPKKFTITVGCLIFISVLFAVALLVQKCNVPAPHLASAEDPLMRYSASTEKLSKYHDMQLIVSTHEITKTKENMFQTAAQQNVTYLNLDSNDLQISAIETVDMNHHSLQISSTYANGTLYYSLNDTNFMGSCSLEALSAHFPPAVILDSSLYQNIAGLQAGESTVIHFRQSAKAESWTQVDAADFLDAWGSAWLNNNNDLVQSTYNLCYTKGDLIVYRSVTVRIVGLDPAPISVPTDLSHYTQLSTPLLPMQLETACGYLLQAQSIEANHTGSIVCHIFGDTRLQNIDISIRNDPENPFYEMATTVEITNNSREGEVLASKQVQRYSNGSYTLSANNEAAVTTEGISPQQLLSGCQEVLVGTILLPDHVQDVKMTYTNDGCRIEFSATNDFAQKVISDACTLLYSEPQLLDELSAKHHIDRILCYLEFCNDTGLPVKSGIHLLATYYVSDLPYQLIFNSDQTYLIP